MTKFGLYICKICFKLVLAGYIYDAIGENYAYISIVIDLKRKNKTDREREREKVETWGEAHGDAVEIGFKNACEKYRLYDPTHPKSLHHQQHFVTTIVIFLFFDFLFFLVSTIHVPRIENVGPISHSQNLICIFFCHYNMIYIIYHHSRNLSLTKNEKHGFLFSICFDFEISRLHKKKLRFERLKSWMRFKSK